MADISHLERMGRELKCPICLSLLDSAVSLTCNHVFCNTCIEKSMKSASVCPVCKVPYRRREIRPAPHMDNLVTVYKSMEAASGVDIFSTQSTAPTKLPGEDNQTGRRTCEVEPQYVGKIQHEIADSENNKQLRKKGSKKTSISKKKDIGSNLGRPSFPAKKRVQVPLHTTETAMQPEKVNAGSDRHETKKDHERNDMMTMSEKRKPNLAPFFWLREDADLEKVSQQTDGDLEMYTPPEVPSFSDIKDSDDDAPCERSPKVVDTRSSDVDFIDSEMFDWTQRPCSPELCSSSLAMQIDDTEDTAEANCGKAASLVMLKATGKRKTGKASANKSQVRECTKRLGNPIENKQRKKTKTTETTAVHVGSGKDENPDLLENSKSKEGDMTEKTMVKKARKTSGIKGGVKECNRRLSNPTEIRQIKKTKSTERIAIHVNSRKDTDQDMLENSKSIDNSSSLNRKNRKCSIKEAETQEVARSDGTEANANSIASPKVKGRNTRESSKSKTSCRNGNSVIKANARGKRSGAINKSKTICDQANDDQPDDILVSHSNNNLLASSSNKETSDRGMMSATCEGDRIKVSGSLKKVKFSMEGISKGNSRSLPSSAIEEVAERGEPQSRTYQCEMDLAKTNKAIPTLIKCKTLPSAVHCAFCQSSEESEASGSMIHYLNGKLVSDTDSTGPNCVHVHKYCTEWAPNVFFNGDNVMNLENELSRSRRIKCACCSEKGAALGCYEKSCRRSFHVTCARLTPLCRWDYENFVMLCPSHASCQLPNETPKPQSKPRRKSAAESKSHHNIGIATDECQSSSMLQWKSQKGLKSLFLCCSALTNTEQDVVNEFESLSGVTILKKWESSVTHVIASTDENGACRRTLKYLMGVLEGKWILSVNWLKACKAAGELVDEQPYELTVDIHGICDGPRLGRLRFLNKQPKLFDRCNFFFMGDFAPSYKGYLHDLVIAAGGKVLNRKPILGDADGPSRCSVTTTYIIYSVELPEKQKPSNASLLLNNRRKDAEAIAASTGSVAASNSWILTTIAGHKLQDL